MQEFLELGQHMSHGPLTDKRTSYDGPRLHQTHFIIPFRISVKIFSSQEILESGQYMSHRPLTDKRTSYDGPRLTSDTLTSLYRFAFLLKYFHLKNYLEQVNI